MLATGHRYGSHVVHKICLGSTVVYQMPPIEFTVEGTTFEPWLELHDGASTDIAWVDDSDGTVLSTDLAPTLTFPDSTPRVVRLEAGSPSAISMLNLGYHNGQDTGPVSIPSTYNHPTQPVTAIANLQYLSGLVWFMAARTNGASPDYTLYSGPLLGGFLSFSGLSRLEHIECFRAEIQSATLAGCAALVRLCFEGCQVTTLDLNPVRRTLVDLRAAIQQGGAGITFATLDGPLETLYHFCVRDQPIINMPDPGTTMPSIVQLWIWNAGQTGTLSVTGSVTLDSVLAHNNSYTAADFSATSWGATSRLWLDGNDLATINLDGIGTPGPADTKLGGNGLPEAQVDYVLSQAALWGRIGGSLDLTGNAAPSAAADADIAALEADDWTLSYVAPAPDRTLLWEDSFDRAAGTPGNGWAAGVSAVAPTLDGAGALVFPSGTTYYTYVNPATGTLPADLSIEVDFTRPLATGERWWGILARENSADLSGAKVLLSLDNNTQCRLGSAATSSGSSLTLTPPATWLDAGVHTLRVDLIGTTIAIYMDGELAGSGANTTNASLTNGRIGLCGEPRGRAWNAFRAYAV